MFGRPEDVAVISLGAAAPRLSPEQALAALAHFPPGRIAVALRRNKAILIADDRLREIAVGGGPHASAASEIRADLAQLVEANEGRHALLERRVDLLGEMARQAQIGMGAMKGLSSARLYPESLRPRRDLGDIDLFVDTADGAWELTRLLAEDGYQYDPGEPPWIKRAPDGRVYGQIRLVPPADTHDLAIDIHFDRYSVRHCAWLELDAELPAGEVSYIEPIENFPFVVADAASDFFISTKLVNDFYFLIERTGVPAGDFVERLRAAKLERFFATVARRMADVAALPEAHRRALGDVAEASAEPTPPVDDFDLRGRMRVTTLHAFRVGQERGLAEAARNSASAFAYYRKPLRLRLSRRSRPVRISEASPTRCTRLIPVDKVRQELGGDGPAADGARPAAAPARRWQPVPGATRMLALPTVAGDLVRVGSDVFIPTVWFGVPAQLLTTATTIMP